MYSDVLRKYQIMVLLFFIVLGIILSLNFPVTGKPYSAIILSSILMILIRLILRRSKLDLMIISGLVFGFTLYNTSLHYNQINNYQSVLPLNQKLKIGVIGTVNQAPELYLNWARIRIKVNKIAIKNKWKSGAF